ncbi:LptF/LptG family permease [Desulfovibrio sp. OttesenSCG-928-C06]|nr:LptF/LptG family permease [Desulfovibrio sp. OttesenSCG-928-C06]
MNFLPFNTLHRRTMLEMTHTFMISSVFLLALVLLGRGVQMRQLFASLNMTVLDFALLLVYLAPSFLMIVVPFSCMLSVFMTLMRMSSDRELVALKAGGVSILQVLPGPMWFASICCVVTLSLSLFGISWGTAEFRSTILHLANTKAQLNLQPGIFNQDIAGVTLFARQIDPDSGELRQVIIEDKSGSQSSVGGSGTVLTILAPKAEIVTDEASGDMVFRFWNGKTYIVRGNGSSSVANYRYFEHRLSLSRLLSGYSLDGVKPRDMSWKELKRLKDDIPNYIEKDPKLASRVLVEMQKRWSLPMACLVLGMFAVPLACSFENTRRQMGVVLALLTFLTYYSLYSAGITLGESGRLSPVVAMWLPNAVFFALGLVGLVMASREGAPDFSRFLSRLRFKRGKKGAA